ncbi:MAG TPA: hypothetical protein VJH97_01080 [Candidatus Nanoarchaeia archaeon]|nr:hypothetical protein [Candidatus Nanoarchaeia archaeon]
MATFLDVTALEYFAPFFVFLFVWLAVYALLQYTKVLGQNQAISVIIGLVIALLVLFSPIATGVIQYISPWFAVIFIFAILATVALKVMGATDAEIANAPIRSIVGIIIILVLIIGALNFIRGEVSVPGDNETAIDYGDTAAVIFHPNILGAIFILVIAVFAVALLAAKNK